MTKHYQQFADSFTTSTRTNGDEFILLKDDAPQEYTDIVRQLHHGMLPDDIAYREISICADYLADDEELDDYPEADWRTSDLLDWFADNTDAVDEFAQEFGVESKSFDVIGLISAAQCYARMQMCQELKDALDLLEDDEEETDEDNE